MDISGKKCIKEPEEPGIVLGLKTQSTEREIHEKGSFSVPLARVGIRKSSRHDLPEPACHPPPHRDEGGTFRLRAGQREFRPC